LLFSPSTKPRDILFSREASRSSRLERLETRGDASRSHARTSRLAWRRGNPRFSYEHGSPRPLKSAQITHSFPRRPFIGRVARTECESRPEGVRNRPDVGRSARTIEVQLGTGRVGSVETDLLDKRRRFCAWTSPPRDRVTASCGRRSVRPRPSASEACEAAWQRLGSNFPIPIWTGRKRSSTKRTSRRRLTPKLPPRQQQASWSDFLPPHTRLPQMGMLLKSWRIRVRIDTGAGGASDSCGQTALGA
jgi:hypothetical protein